MFRKGPGGAAVLALSESSIAPPREFDFSDDDFRALTKLAYEHAGISLSDSKRNLVYSRLSRRLRMLKMGTFREYRDYLLNEAGEIENFINSISTNHTKFFREDHHFEHFRARVAVPYAQSASQAGMRVWSAGCSSGEEPYSLAMTILEVLPDVHRWDVRILATDLDSDVLERGRRGVYTEDRLKNLTLQRRTRFFRERREREGLCYEVAPELKSLITFKQLNLMHALPMRGPLDAIFCRNVVIYFDKDTQRDLFSRVAQLQSSGNLLFLGHSESLFKVSEQYALIGKTVYRRAG
jgi:chemotaxis protein methyltransferase CheR